MAEDRADIPGDFDDLLAANRDFAADFDLGGFDGVARAGVAIVTCMDSRINPLAVLGMEEGDVKILRNAGARVTDDVLRTLVLASYLLNVKRVLIMPHTDCKMASATEDQIHETIANDFGVDIRSIEVRVVPDQRDALERDVTRVRAYPFLPDDLIVGGAIYDVKTGSLNPQDF